MIDRFLGAVCALFVALMTIVVITSRNWSVGWAASAVLTLGLAIWARRGLRFIPVGWRGQLLFLGQRMDATLGEGWRWVPFPFGLKTADCRETILKLDPLRIFTSDLVEVKVDGSIVYKIVNLNLYFGVESSGFKQGLDDIWDEVIRTQVVLTSLAQALAMHATLGQQARAAFEEQASTRWGIEVVRVVVAAITPADQKVSDDIALRLREERQREGQRVELRHFTDRVTELMASPPTGAGLTREQAIEQVQLALGQTTKATDAKTLAIDPAAAEIIARILGRRP